MGVIIVRLTEIEPRPGEKQVVADYGIDADTLQNVPLPPVSVYELGAKWDSTLMEWVIR